MYDQHNFTCSPNYNGSQDYSSSCCLGSKTMLFPTFCGFIPASYSRHSFQNQHRHLISEANIVNRHWQDAFTDKIPRIKLPAKQKYCISNHCWYHLFDAHCYRSADSKCVNQKHLLWLVCNEKPSHKSSAFTRRTAIRPSHGLIGLAPSARTSPARKMLIRWVQCHNAPTYRFCLERVALRGTNSKN